MPSKSPFLSSSFFLLHLHLHLLTPLIASQPNLLTSSTTTTIINGPTPTTPPIAGLNFTNMEGTDSERTASLLTTTATTTTTTTTTSAKCSLMRSGHVSCGALREMEEEKKVLTAVLPEKMRGRIARPHYRLREGEGEGHVVGGGVE